MNSLDVSVIVSSYNQPNTLKRVLAGFAAQDDLRFELVIADDGSQEDTEALVTEFRGHAPFDVKFVTQEDKGFRKSLALNKTVLESQGSLLIFSDGDTVPFRNYVSVQRRYLRPMNFCVGGYIHLTLEQSRDLTPEEITLGRHERFLNPKVRRYLASVHYHNILYRFLRKGDKPKILGGNFSVGREAMFAVNGFEEGFEGIGKEDSDIRNRLRNLGCSGVSLWNKAFTCHLDHQLDPRRCQKAVERKHGARELYEANRDKIRSSRGLDGHPSK